MTERRAERVVRMEEEVKQKSERMV